MSAVGRQDIFRVKILTFTDRFVVDVVIVNVDHFIDSVFTLECNKSEPYNVSQHHASNYSIQWHNPLT